MNTIYNYVESVFINLPQTAEMIRLKEDMLRNMEDKYQDLKADGVNENEAIGTVLTEFGNIDEIIDEYNISPEDDSFTENKNEIYLSDDDAEDYLEHRHKFAFAIALGVFLCIIAVALFFSVISFFQFLFPSISENVSGVIAIATLLLIVAISIGLFIIFGLKEANYPFEKKILNLDPRTYSRIKVEYDSFNPRFAYAIAIGVVLCILGPISLLLTVTLLGDQYPLSIVFLLGFVAIGVFLFIYYGIQKNTFQKLLTIGSHTRAQVKVNTLTDSVANIIFPIATLYYLYQGFFNNNWGVAWIVFPIVGILFAVFAAITEVITNRRDYR
ncbi:permease prefix domain 1-containing protein [Jeotgalibaca sp. MA1X17-3]|uniref:permease prefix domain 1-containing protein n=1 Tax=Jeotgalibaca sp. MA1X17-3 TaxID=2908211 RepID=UPI001F208C6E|nr:permease prefix domain 1-containing protein [Jeotgalibaca sp. MA1X17-3]UJF16367.1 permease prefix domain 1-containing protein [Jeotgalibaca sp. MA1X17-3]